MGCNSRCKLPKIRPRHCSTKLDSKQIIRYSKCLRLLNSLRKNKKEMLKVSKNIMFRLSTVFDCIRLVSTCLVSWNLSMKQFVRCSQFHRFPQISTVQSRYVCSFESSSIFLLPGSFASRGSHFSMSLKFR